MGLQHCYYPEGNTSTDVCCNYFHHGACVTECPDPLTPGTTFECDKGRATVVMNRKDYKDKINSMLSDEQTYHKVDKDPALSLERKLNSLLLSLKKKGSLCQTMNDRLHSIGGLTPFVYGLPMILLKPDVPLRPIVSFCTSPSYQFSKFLAKLLTPLFGNSISSVRNSAEFQSFIALQKLKSDEVLVSFDVFLFLLTFRLSWL